MNSKESVTPGAEGVVFLEAALELEMLPILFLCSFFKLKFGETLWPLKGVVGGVSCSVMCSRSPPLANWTRVPLLTSEKENKCDSKLSSYTNIRYLLNR